jgi:hypothetical protein
MSARHKDVLPAIAARDRAAKRLRGVTASVGVASVMASGAVAFVLPGSTHASVTSPAASSSSGRTSGSAAKASSRSSAKASSRKKSSSGKLKSAAAPAASSGSSSAVSGGS